MKLLMTTLMVGMLLAVPVSTLADVHPEVQAAINYELPVNTCGKKVAVDGANVTAPAQESGGVSFFEGSSTASVSDVDSYSRKRLERKEKRRQKCVKKYKQVLLDDSERLKASAQHGLTQQQAKAILSNMALIQKVYMTQNATLEEVAALDQTKGTEQGQNQGDG